MTDSDLIRLWQLLVALRTSGLAASHDHTLAALQDRVRHLLEASDGWRQ